MYTIVTGLKRFLKGTGNQSANAILNAINVDKVAFQRTIDDDAFVLTTAFFEYSIYLNFEFEKKIEENAPDMLDYFETLNTTVLRNLMFSIQGKTGKNGKGTYQPLDPDYKALKESLPLTQRMAQNYDTQYRAAIFQQAMQTFEVNFKTHIKRNMKRRLIRYFRQVPDDQGKKMEKGDAFEHVHKLLGERINEEDPRLGVSFKDLEEVPFKYIPLLYRLKADLVAAKAEAFNVVPCNKAKMKFVHYTNTGVAELVARYCKDTGQVIPPVNKLKPLAREIWIRFFHIEKFENEKAGKKFRGLLTNGIQANLLMDRPKKEKPFKSVRGSTRNHRVKWARGKALPAYDRIVANDPGKRLVIGAIAYNIETGEAEEIKLKSSTYLHKTGYKRMMRRHKRHSGKLEAFIAKKREALGNIGRAGNYRDNTRFELSWMLARVLLYSQPKFRYMRFNFYRTKRRFIDRYVAKKICPRNKSTLICNGSAKFGPCIKG